MIIVPHKTLVGIQQQASVNVHLAIKLPIRIVNVVRIHLRSSEYANIVKKNHVLLSCMYTQLFAYQQTFSAQVVRWIDRMISLVPIDSVHTLYYVQQASVAVRAIKVFRIQREIFVVS
jgi:hypothetical protein